MQIGTRNSGVFVATKTASGSLRGLWTYGVAVRSTGDQAGPFRRTGLLILGRTGILRVSHQMENTATMNAAERFLLRRPPF